MGKVIPVTFEKVVADVAALAAAASSELQLFGTSRTVEGLSGGKLENGARADLLGIQIQPQQRGAVTAAAALDVHKFVNEGWFSLTVAGRPCISGPVSHFPAGGTWMFGELNTTVALHAQNGTLSRTLLLPYPIEMDQVIQAKITGGPTALAAPLYVRVGLQLAVTEYLQG